jgi:hypothetical protein
MSGIDKTTHDRTIGEQALCEQGRAAATPDEAVLLQRVKQNLDRSCAALDGATQSRLNSMRHAALAEGQRRASGGAFGRLGSLRMPQLLPFGGVITACALAIAVLVQLPSLPGSGSLPDTAPVEDLDLLVATEELDFYEEIEFYQWLATSDAGY